MKKVSVCVVTYNSGDDIESCLEAVIAQTYTNIEIIVVDNASKDESTWLVKELQTRYSKIKLITNDQNTGFAGGQNLAIKHASGEYILVLNPDLELNPMFIQNMIEVLEKEDKVGSASGLIMLKDNPSLVDTTGLTMPFNRHAVDRGQGEAIENWKKPDYIFGPSGAAAMYKREMIDAIMLNGEFFDEHFFAYKEDVDVAWRAQLLGWRSLYIPTATGVHARGWKAGGRHQISSFVRQHSYMNQIFMLIKNEQLDSSFIFRIIVLVGRELAKLLYAVVKERDLLQSWHTIFKLLPVMREKRMQLKYKKTKNNI